jgi:hypothetical protein
LRYHIDHLFTFSFGDCQPKKLVNFSYSAFIDLAGLC